MKPQHLSMLIRSKQNGAALVVSLVLLAVVTLIGVTGMQNATTELKIATAAQDHATAFSAAEAALLQVEEQLALLPPDREKLLSTCVGERCFTKTCSAGLCFQGAYINADTQWDCKTTSGAAEAIDYWSDATLNIWKTAARHKSIKINRLDAEVKYIVEFLCYVQRDPLAPFNATTASTKNNGAPLYRITTLAEGNGARGRVMLQSTYKVLSGS
jgi:type IV pilus assembly protein PilX